MTFSCLLTLKIERKTWALLNRRSNSESRSKTITAAAMFVFYTTKPCWSNNNGLVFYLFYEDLYAPAFAHTIHSNYQVWRSYHCMMSEFNTFVFYSSSWKDFGNLLGCSCDYVLWENIIFCLNIVIWLFIIS